VSKHIGYAFWQVRCRLPNGKRLKEAQATLGRPNEKAKGQISALRAAPPNRGPDMMGAELISVVSEYAMHNLRVVL
jgi:hypothetical protein